MSTIVAYKTPEPTDTAPLTLLYLAGPITGIDGYRENFTDAATLLNKHGFVVVNPANLDLGDQATWQDYMRTTTRLLTACTGVALLPGWEASRGARVEATWAAAVGIPVATLGQWVYNEPDITPSLFAPALFTEILAERYRQHTIYGWQDLPMARSDPEQHARLAKVFKDHNLGWPTWSDVILAEVHEVFAETDPANRRTELVQLAALCIQLIETEARHDAQS